MYHLLHIPYTVYSIYHVLSTIYKDPDVERAFWAPKISPFKGSPDSASKSASNCGCAPPTPGSQGACNGRDMDPLKRIRALLKGR